MFIVAAMRHLVFALAVGAIASVASAAHRSLKPLDSGRSRFAAAPRARAMHMCQLVRRAAPDFEAEGVFDQEFLNVCLSEYCKDRGQYVVLLFYPLDFTFVCPTELTAFSDIYEDFQSLNTEILAVSVDSKYAHLAWTQTPRMDGGVGELNFPLVSDITKSIARSYGMLLEDEGVALRGLFIIDPDGIVQHMAVNDLSFGQNPEEVLRTLQAIQYVASHPDELCPAGWTPGDRAIPDSVVGASEYFAEMASSSEPTPL